MALTVAPVQNGGLGTGVATTPVQGGSGAALLQPTVAPSYGQTLSQPGAKNTALVSSGVSTPVSGGNTQAAADAAQAATLRAQISGLINTVKDIYNSRYGVIDQAAGDQEANLNNRFATESGQLQDQIGQQNDQAGAAYAGNGVYDSSYRGNSQDQITKAGTQQIAGLGDELKTNLATVGQWDASQKAGIDAGKSAADQLVSQIAQETNPTNLVTLRNQIDNQIASLQGSGADNLTQPAALAQLESVAPSTPRAQQLQVTLQSILHGNADPTTKAAIGSSLIAAADIPGSDQSKLLQAFHTDLAASSDQSQS